VAVLICDIPSSLLSALTTRADASAGETVSHMVTAALAQYLDKSVHTLFGSVANLADQSARCTFAGNGFGGGQVTIEFKGSHFERDLILWAVRWYVAYPISYRQLEEMMEEHGVEVDHATVNRITERSSGWCDRCSGSSPFGQPR
jgi:hypothetical protein